MINFSSPKEIDAYLAANGLAATKRFGQNFLVNSNARTLLIDESLRCKPRSIWEIGPGIGALTDELAASGTRLTLFEIDAGFVRLLEERFRDTSTVRVVSGDFVRTWKKIQEAEGFPDVITGNLPYNAAAQIVLDLFEYAAPSRLVFTVQNEVAQRMMAPVASVAYSSYSIICQAGWSIRKLGKLKPGSFHPRPRVDSMMISLEPRGDLVIDDRAFFLDLCRCLFAARRKTIKNNLSRCGVLSAMESRQRIALSEQNGVACDSRAEELPPEKVVLLAGALLRAIPLKRSHSGKTRTE